MLGPMAVEQTSDFLVAPSAGLVLLTVLLIVALVCGVVTALKGRLGWLAIGLVTGSLLWLATAFLIATPGSPWARLFYGDAKRRRSSAHFAASS
jgi:hypothetical protein